MPYHVQKVKGGYFVETDGTNKRHSQEPMPYGMAVKQMRALYANMSPSEKAQMAATRGMHGMQKMPKKGMKNG